MAYFMLTKDEISLTHKLSSYENKVVGDKTDGKINTQHYKRRK